MPEHDRDFSSTTPRPEPGPQPDPMLNEGRAGSARTWAVTGVIIAVLLAVMYGVTTHRAEVKDEARQATEQQTPVPAATQPNAPGGRTTADAPPAPAPKSGG